MDNAHPTASGAPGSAAGAWWETLPENYYLQRGGTEIDRRFRLQVGATALADRALRTGLGSLISGALAPNVLLPWLSRHDRALLPFYRECVQLGDPDRVFLPPPEGVPVRDHGSRMLDFAPRGVHVRHLSFESPFRTLHPAMAAAYRGLHRNRTAHALHLVHGDRPRPTLVFLHGYLLSGYRTNTRGFSLGWLYKKGYDVLQVTLPHHGQRAERHHPWSGYGFFSGGLAHTNEAMLQAVFDTRVWINYLLDSGAPSVGVSGLSLGGYITALMAVVEPRLAFCIPNSPVVSPADMVMQWQPTGTFVRRLGPHLGFSLGELRRAMALHSPLSYAPRLSADRLLIISGAGDRLTSPLMVRLLHEHWKGSHMHWFPGNHVVHLRQAQYLRHMRAFMDRHCHDGHGS